MGPGMWFPALCNRASWAEVSAFVAMGWSEQRPSRRGAEREQVELFSQLQSCLVARPGSSSCYANNKVFSTAGMSALLLSISLFHSLYFALFLFFFSFESLITLLQLPLKKKKFLTWSPAWSGEPSTLHMWSWWFMPRSKAAVRPRWL